MRFITLRLVLPLLLSAAAVFGTVMLYGCGGGKSELIGKWVYIVGSDKTSKDDEGSMELFKDGTGVVAGSGSITWKIENKRFVMLSAIGGVACDYDVSGSLLTLKDGGDSSKFVKVKAGSQPSGLIGHWVCYAGDRGWKKLKDMELLKDGTGVNGKSGITWKVENKLYVIESSKAFSAVYKVSGSILTLVYDDSTNGKFINKNNSAIESSASSFTDDRDGKKYKTVKIAEQIWMAENLGYRPEAGKSLCYENDNSNCDKYGRMYDWNIAVSVCPSGWHLPTENEWDELVGFVNVAGGGEAGKKLRAASGWEDDGNGTDDYGFSILPGGQGDGAGRFSSIGKFGYLWSASDSRAYPTTARTVNIDFKKWDVRWDTDYKSNFANVRCLKND
jgi:uncharacterized protein (TIGR02145 family)